MDDKLVTCDLILLWLQKKIEKKEPIAPETMIDAAEKLNVLIADEHDKYLKLAQEVAQIRLDLLSCEPKPSVAEVKVRVEARDEYREMLRQKAKIGIIEEHIRLAKIRARMGGDEARGYH